MNWFGIAFLFGVLGIAFGLFAIAASMTPEHKAPPRLPIDQPQSWRIIGSDDRPFDWQRD